MKKVKINLKGNGIIPFKGSAGSAGYDVSIPEDIMIRPGRQVVPLDFSIELPESYEAEIRPRSGISIRGIEDITGITREIDVITGTIDSDYRGTVGVIVKNDSEDFFFLKRGTRIAQMIINRYEDVEWETSDSLDDTERGVHGYGSTGIY